MNKTVCVRSCVQMWNADIAEPLKAICVNVLYGMMRGEINVAQNYWHPGQHWTATLQTGPVRTWQ